MFDRNPDPSETKAHIKAEGSILTKSIAPNLAWVSTKYQEHAYDAAVAALDATSVVALALKAMSESGPASTWGSLPATYQVTAALPRLTLRGLGFTGGGGLAACLVCWRSRQQMSEAFEAVRDTHTLL